MLDGEPLRVILQRVDMKGRSLRWLVENLRANHGYYLLGELYVDADKVVNVSQIEPVIWGGNKVKLHYAKAEDLQDYLNLTAIQGEVVELSFSGGGKESGDTWWGRDYCNDHK